ncbi:hypothetical protein N658DRAFT_153656 [Parathielavia hyrcaniae]|uniref:Uncharacterized protein n=1 Tax=Parathielavia hyrcaniae TaxID=113614 RepID=A0AAN6Q2I4_9PEZI|nr:hypothetical protein N658DRAFT_153656 [Parathielavia hyrcaniae]
MSSHYGFHERPDFLMSWGDAVGNCQRPRDTPWFCFNPADDQTGPSPREIGRSGGAQATSARPTSGSRTAGLGRLGMGDGAFPDAIHVTRSLVKQLLIFRHQTMNLKRPHRVKEGVLRRRRCPTCKARSGIKVAHIPQGVTSRNTHYRRSAGKPPNSFSM